MKSRLVGLVLALSVLGVAEASEVQNVPGCDPQLPEAVREIAVREITVDVLADPRLASGAVGRLAIRGVDADGEDTHSTEQGTEEVSSTEKVSSTSWIETETVVLPRAEPLSVRVPSQCAVEITILAETVDAVWASTVAAQPEDGAVVVHVAPAAELRGRLRASPDPADHDLAVTVLAAGFDGPLDETGVEPVGDRVPIPCALEDRRFSCRIPALEVDLRLSVPGKVPHYLWSLHPSEQRALDIGEVTLRAGASISGWVVPLDGSTAPVTVRSEPTVSGWMGDPSARRRMDSLRVEVVADPRGFFQLGPLAPGAFEIVAEQEGARPARVGDLNVRGAHELRLEGPIELRAPLTVDFVLDPPAGPGGEPWLVTVSTTSRTSTVLQVVASEPATLGGFFRLDQAAPGTYRVDVGTADGGRWLSDELEIGPADSLRTISIPSVPIEGRVVQGDEGLRATVVFGTSQGAQRVVVESDEAGRFEGLVPREGLWPIELLDEAGQAMAALEPQVIEPGPGGTPARLLLEIPNTVVAGRVVDDAGEPVVDASVLAVRLGEEKRRESMIRVDDEGRFTLRGLAEGEVQLRAYDEGASSGWQTVRVGADEASSIELVLKQRRELVGQVRAGGYAVAGAQLFIQPEGSAVAGVERVVTGPGGRFALEVDRETTALDVLVDAPGFGLAMSRRPIGSEGPIGIDVSTDTGTLHLVGDLQALSATAFVRRRGAPFSLSMLFALLGRSGRMQPASDRVTLHGVEPGVYTLCLGGPTSCRSTRVLPGAEAILSIEDEGVGS